MVRRAMRCAAATWLSLVIPAASGGCRPYGAPTAPNAALRDAVAPSRVEPAASVSTGDSSPKTATSPPVSAAPPAPEDAHAASGHAKLLAKRYADALKAFDEPLQSIGDATGSAEVWLDRGLAQAALGHVREADEAFYWSDRMRPSPATRAHMTDKHFCPILVGRPDDEAEPFADWLDWWTKKIERVNQDPDMDPRSPGYAEPRSDHDAQERACAHCKGPGPWVVSFGSTKFEFRVMALRKGKLLDFGVVGGGFSPIGPNYWDYYQDTIELRRAGAFTLVHAVSAPTFSHELCAMSAAPRDAALHEDCSASRGSNTRAERYFVLDLERGRIVTTVDERQYFPAVDVSSEFTLPPLPVRITPGADRFVLSNTADCDPIPYTVKAP